MKTILTILLSLLAISGYSQNSRRLNQLYGFRLGMTIEEMKKEVETIDLEEDSKPDTLIASSNLNGRLRSFRLPKHIVGAMHDLIDVRFFFFDNSLYTIEVHNFNSDTETYLTKKYGKSTTRTVVEAEKSRLNAKQPYMWISQDWKTDTNKALNCTSSVYLDRNLEIMAYILIIVDTDVYQQVMKLGMDERLKK